MSIEILSKQEIDLKFQNQVRHYLVGNFPDSTLKDNNVEVGISCYQTFTADNPHYHSKVTEYQYILSGMSVIYDLDAEMQYTLNEGDFYIVHSNTRYAEKHKPNTRILFFKYPGQNDKVLIPIDDALAAWLLSENF